MLVRKSELIFFLSLQEGFASDASRIRLRTSVQTDKSLVQLNHEINRYDKCFDRCDICFDDSLLLRKKRRKLLIPNRFMPTRLIALTLRYISPSFLRFFLTEFKRYEASVTRGSMRKLYLFLFVLAMTNIWYTILLSRQYFNEVYRRVTISHKTVLLRVISTCP